jgi:CGNR zinc finger protein
LSDAERVGFAEVWKMQKRVGRTAKERLQWALKFIQRDLDAVSIDELASLQREYLAFSDVRIPPSRVNTPWIRTVLHGRSWERAWLRQKQRSRRGRPRKDGSSAELADLVKIGDPSPRPLPTHDDLQRSQRDWKHIIGQLLSDKRVSVGPFTVHIRISQSESHADAIPVADRPEEAARLALANLLGAYAHLLGKCREVECQTLFVGARRGQGFCSRTCQNRVAIRAHRERVRRAAGKNSRRGEGS